MACYDTVQPSVKSTIATIVVPDGPEATVPWLGHTDFETLFTETLALLLADPARRRFLFRGVHAGWVAHLTQPAATTFDQLLQDLAALDAQGPLLDGVVPLRVWLTNASFLARSTGAASAPLFERLRDDVADRSERRPAMTELLEPEGGREVVIHEPDFLAAGFLARGAALARAVGRMEVARYLAGAPELGPNGEPRLGLGTGWLLAPGLVLTNHHVLAARGPDEAAATPADWQAQARAAAIRFDYDGDGDAGVLVPVEEVVAFDEAHDFALLRLARAEPERRWFLERRDVRAGETANIIQHPSGLPKRVVVRNNLVHIVKDDVLRYFTDTEAGSSGSPVCNDAWEVVGLHRSWRRVSGGVRYQGKDVFYVNEGATMAAVCDSLTRTGAWDRVVEARG